MFQYLTKVGVSDTNADGVLSLRSALDMIIDCCYFQLPTEKRFNEHLQALDLGMFLIYRHLDIVRRPAYGEALSVETSIFDCKPMIGYRNTVIRDADGKFCVKEYSLGAFVNFVTGHPAKLPPEVMASINYDPKIDMEYTSRKIALPPQDRFAKILEQRASANFLDMNGHVNSNWYVSLAEECLPDDFNYDRIRVEYRNQAKKGDTISCFSAFADPQHLLINVADRDLNSFAVIEFSINH